jgi:YVTN family beta-propeller protein
MTRTTALRRSALAMILAAVAIPIVGSAQPVTGAGSTSRASAFVSNVDGDTVSVIDPATQTVLTEIAVGSEPRNLAPNPDGSRMYVPNRFGDSVSVIDTADNTVVDTVTDASFDEPYAVTVTPDGSRVYVANKEGGGSSTGSVTVIDAATNTVVDNVDDPCFSSPEGIVADPVRARVYLINRNTNASTDHQVCIINTNTNTVSGAVSVGSEPRYGVVTPDGSALFTSNNSSGDVSRVALDSGNTVTTINVNASPRNMVLSNDATKLYVATQTDEVSVITVADSSVDVIDFPGASSLYAVAVIPGTDFGYATDEDDDNVRVFDTSTDTEITGAGFPITSAFDTPRAIAAVGDPAVPPPPPPPPPPEPSAEPIAQTPTFTG